MWVCLRLSGDVMRGICVDSPTMISLAGGGEVLQVRGGGVKVLERGVAFWLALGR